MVFILCWRFIWRILNFWKNKPCLNLNTYINYSKEIARPIKKIVSCLFVFNFTLQYYILQNAYLLEDTWLLHSFFWIADGWAIFHLKIFQQQGK